MKWARGIAGCWLALLPVLLGCADGGAPPATVSRNGVPVPISRDMKGQQGPFPARGFFVIRRPEAWTALWHGQSAPAVDFTTQSVLVALMGQQPTSGFDITISDVRTINQQVVAYLTEARPTSQETVTPTISYPYDMVIVPKLEQQVVVVTESNAPAMVAVEDEFPGTYSAAGAPGTTVIRTPEAWSQFWLTTIGGTATAPAVDFTQNMAVAVLAGPQPTTGYTVDIAGIGQENDRLNVHYQIVPPSVGTAAPTVTSPYVVAVVPASPLPIAFQSLAAPAVASATGEGKTDAVATPVAVQTVMPSAPTGGK